MKVLVVDDKSENLYLLESILKGSGYFTVSAKNGAEALGLARKDIPDLIITDILMPVMDGFTLCREFKKDGKLCNVPFIFYTATYTDPRDEEFALSLGADRFILKPQDPEEFIAIVKELLKEEKKKNTQTIESPSTSDTVILKEYNEALVRKLEDKMLKLEQAEKEIRKTNILLLNEIDERKRAENMIIENEKFLKETQKIAQLGSYTLDVNTGIWKSSEILDSIFGIEPDFHKSIDGWTSIIHPEWQHLMANYFANEVIGLKKPFDKEYKIIRRNDKSERWVHGLGELVFDKEDEPIKMIGTIRDITELKNAQLEITNLNRIYALLSNTNQAVVRIKDKQKLFNEICRIAIEDGKFRMAWIGLVNNDTNKLDVTAFAGLIENYLEDINLNLSDEISSQCSSGIAIKNGTNIIANDIENDKNIYPWKENALRLGYKSSAAFPLKVLGKVIGAFSIYTSQKDFFHQQEIILLDEMAMDISFALEFLETEKIRIKTEENLYQSEERFRTLYENSTIGLYRTTPSGKILLANPTLVRMLGYTSFVELAKRDLGKDGFEPDYNRKLFIDHIEADGEVRGFESAWTKKDGTIIYVFESAKAIRDSNGKTLYYDGSVEDISERKKAENELLKSELRFKQISDNAEEWIWEVDKNGLYTYSSPIVKKILGYKFDELVGKKHFYDFFDPEIKEDLKQATLGAFANKASIKDFVNCNIHKDGRKIILSTSGIPIVDKDDNLIGYRGVDVDVTEREQAEEKLRKSEEKYRSIFENVQDVYYETLLDGTILEVSPSIESMSNKQYRRTDLVGRSMYEFYADSEIPAAILSEIQKEGRVNDFEVQFKNKDGSVIYCSVSAKISLNAEGQPEKIVGSMHDITLRKQTEKLNQALYGISQAIYSTENIDEFYEHIHQDLSGIIPAQNFFIALLTNDEKELYLSYNRDEKDADEKWTIDAADPQSLTVEVLKSRRPLLLDEKKLNARYSSGKNKVWGTAPKCWLGVPLMIKEKAIGIIAVQDYDRDDVYSQKDVSLFELAAVQIAIAIERKRTEEALRESEVRLNEAMQIARLGTWEYDVDSEQFKFNDQFYKIMRTTAEREGGYFMPVMQYVQKFVHPDDMSVVGEETNKALETTDPNYYSHLDHRIIFADGEVGYVSVNIRIDKDSHGRTVKTYGVNQDITERKQAAEALSNERSLLRTIIDLIPDAIYAVDIEGRKILANAKEIELSGKNSEDEIIGKTDFDLFPESEAQRYYEEDQIIIQSGKPTMDMEDTLISKDGQIHWLLGSKVPLRDVHGHIIGIVGVNHDITDRKRSEEALRESQLFIEGIIDAIPVRVFWKDKNLVYLGCNKVFAHDAGFADPKVIVGKDDYQMVWRDQAEQYQSDDRKVIESGESKILFEELQTTPDGNQIALLTSKIPLRNLKGECIGILGTYIDITERKMVEKELIASKEKAEEINKIKSVFFSNMSHELRTPLVAILGFADILSSTIKDESDRSMAVSILQGGKRLLNTLTSLLNLSELESLKENIELNELDINRLCKDLLTQQRAKTKKPHIKFINEFEEESLKIYSNARMLRESLTHLINNAETFTEEGFILLKTYINNVPGSVDKIGVIEVIDTGIGIPVEKLNVVFEEFRQASEGFSRHYEGIGLGLTLTKRYVELMGGSISVVSEQDTGTKFTLSFPIIENIEINSSEITKLKSKEQEVLKPGIGSNKPIKNKRILIVEDDSMNQEYLKKCFANICAFECVTTGEQAVKFSAEHKFDLILMDINLGSGINGITAVQVIRQIEGYKNTPIVAMTAYASNEAKQEFLSKGCSHFISKPFLMKDIVGLVTDIFQK